MDKRKRDMRKRGTLTALLMRVPSGLLPAMVFVAILWLTLAPHPLPPAAMPLIPGLDKLVHACMFGGFYFIILLDVAIRRIVHEKAVFPLVKGKTAVLLALAVVLFGGAIELIQGAMGIGRGCDFADFVADAVGVVIATVLSPVVARFIVGRC